MSIAELWPLAIVFTLAGLTSGLAGFGFSAIGALSLTLLTPTVAISLLLTLSICTQILSLVSLWPELRPHVKPWPHKDSPLTFCLGGVLGLPVGAALLQRLNGGMLLAVFGTFLIGYASYGLLKPVTWRIPPRADWWGTSVLVGATGGFVGGFTAFPGSALVVWNGLRGTSGDVSRSLTQPYIMFMQVIGLALMVGTRPALFDGAFFLLFAALVPVSLLGSALGTTIYKRYAQLNYRRLCLLLLGISGLSLLGKSLWG